ncbi:flagellar hook-associated protein 3 [Occallatibacter savannae]|uniref:flagellin N-terminal helical domain-containing protein n=1 Tax=Occallatibacter savannae TaxID=1002691 RepID=UPI000D68DDC7|nr:flagellar hook-associated protein 3 [Occallatibacter savannae]
MRVDPSYVSNLVDALDSAVSREQRLSNQVASGVRIGAISDDPVAAGRNALLLNQIQADDAFTQTSSLVTGQLQVADSALGSVVGQLNQAISLATSANNGTKNASDVKAIAGQLAGILREVESLANSNYQGQYIFAGGRTMAQPFSTSSATTPGVTTYVGDSDISYLVTPNGQRIQLNVPGDQMFLGANSVFGVLHSLIAELSGGNLNPSQTAQDTEALTATLNYVSQQRVQIDNSITQISAAGEAVTNEKTQLAAAQTELMQADLAEVATQLSLTKTQQTALEAVIVQLGSGSLFDKLQ